MLGVGTYCMVLAFHRLCWRKVVEFANPNAALPAWSTRGCDRSAGGMNKGARGNDYWCLEGSADASCCSTSDQVTEVLVVGVHPPVGRLLHLGLEPFAVAQDHSQDGACIVSHRGWPPAGERLQLQQEGGAVVRVPRVAATGGGALTPGGAGCKWDHAALWGNADSCCPGDARVR
jgi:hypothetical protein